MHRAWRLQRKQARFLFLPYPLLYTVNGQPGCRASFKRDQCCSIYYYDHVGLVRVSGAISLPYHSGRG